MLLNQGFRQCLNSISGTCANDRGSRMSEHGTQKPTRMMGNLADISNCVYITHEGIPPNPGLGQWRARTQAVAAAPLCLLGL